MAKANPKGVFCLECDWWNDFREPSSVEPILDLLDQSDTRTVRHVRRDVGTIAELEHWLKKFGQKACAPYKILYLGFHGRRGAIEVGDQRNPSNHVDLGWLGERLKGKCKGRIVFFGSCSVLDVDKRHIKRFLRTTRAIAACGYRSDVPWMSSVIFELLALQAMQENAFVLRGAKAIERRIKTQAKGLADDLGFRMVIAE